MKKIVFPVLAACLTLACAVSSSVTSGMAVNDTETPLISTEPVIKARSMPTGVKYAVLPVLGCWNLRQSPSVDAPIVRVVCDEKIQVFGAAKNGFVVVSEGYICGQAFGVDNLCQ